MRVWRADHGASGGIDAGGLLGLLRGRGVPVAEIRVRRPGLETLYRDSTGGHVASRRTDLATQASTKAVR